MALERRNRRAARTVEVTERVYEPLPGGGRRLKYVQGQRITEAEAEAAGMTKPASEKGTSEDGVSDKARRPRNTKTKTDG